MLGVADVPAEQAREALRLLGGGGADATTRAGRTRRLQELLRGYGTVRTALERAPAAAREAFIALAHDGPTPVERVLGRGWWGHGRLPPPLDWLQARALVVVTDDGMLHPVREAREGFLELTLDVGAGPVDDEAAGALRVHGARSVVVADAQADLDRALAVGAAELRAVAPGVAVSDRSSRAVSAALRSAGVVLDDDQVVAASAAEPALPDTAEEAAGPRAIRALLDRAVDERRQVRLEYFASSRGGAATERVVDPWTFGDDLLRGYCHLRQGERTFAVDRIGTARLLPSAVQQLEPGAGSAGEQA